jgi:hypothetical protein
MDKRLHELLDELHAELSDAGSLDDVARQELRGLAEEIRFAVGEEDTVELSRLQSATLQLESEHPRIAGILGSIADTLSKLGI